MRSRRVVGKSTTEKTTLRGRRFSIKTHLHVPRPTSFVLPTISSLAVSFIFALQRDARFRLVSRCMGNAGWTADWTTAAFQSVEELQCDEWVDHSVLVSEPTVENKSTVR